MELLSVHLWRIQFAKLLDEQRVRDPEWVLAFKKEKISTQASNFLTLIVGSIYKSRNEQRGDYLHRLLMNKGVC